MNTISQLRKTPLKTVAGLLLLGLFLVTSGCSRNKADYVLDPETLQLLAQAEDLLKANEFTQALAVLDSAEARAPDAAEVPFLRAQVLTEVIRFDEAEAEYRRALKLNPDMRGVWHNLGNNFNRQGKYRNAIACFERELERNQTAMTWRGIGRAYRSLGVSDSAMFAFEKALALDSTYAPAMVDMAQVLDGAAEYERALELVERAMRFGHEGPEIQYLIGSLLVKNARFEDALPHLFKALEAWPWHNPTVYNIGQALARSGRQEEAQQYLEKAESLRATEATIAEMEQSVLISPGDAYVRAGLASLLRQVGRYDEAVFHYQVAIHLDPENLEFQNNVAVLEFLRGNNAASIHWFQRILEKDPTYVDVWMNMGTVLVKSGRPEEARRAWHTALQYDPDNQAVLANLARLELTQQGQAAP
jgi:tetratricopeptide (TPR) repeat protein